MVELESINLINVDNDNILNANLESLQFDCPVVINNIKTRLPISIINISFIQQIITFSINYRFVIKAFDNKNISSDIEKEVLDSMLNKNSTYIIYKIPLFSYDEEKYIKLTQFNNKELIELETLLLKNVLDLGRRLYKILNIVQGPLEFILIKNGETKKLNRVYEKALIFSYERFKWDKLLKNPNLVKLRRDIGSEMNYDYYDFIIKKVYYDEDEDLLEINGYIVEKEYELGKLFELVYLRPFTEYIFAKNYLNKNKIEKSPLTEMIIEIFLDSFK